MTYYHGTPNKFETFNEAFLSHTTGAATALIGFCFATRKSDAEMYGEVLECELNVCNTAYMPISTFLDFEMGEKSDDDAIEYRNELIDRGFDSVEIEGGEVMIVLNSEDIEILN